MTTHTMNGVVADNGTAGSGTAIRAWAQKVHDALAAVGMVQTSDTGQINLSTVTAPAAAGTSAGYEIWRFNDALQATAPVFFKLEYGSGTAATNPQLWITVGKGTDGAGNITGVLFSRRSGISGGSTNGNPVGTGTGYASSGAGCCLALLPFAEGFTGRNQPGFILERSRDSKGVATGEALVLIATGVFNSVASSTSGVASYEAVAYADTSKSAAGILPVVVPGTVGGTAMGPSTSVAAGAVAPLWPWIIYVPGCTPFQVLTGCTYATGDTPATTFSTRALGSVRQFRTIPAGEGHLGYGLATTQGGVSMAHSIQTGLAIRWE